jgi:DNA polymerase III delta subunit
MENFLENKKVEDLKALYFIESKSESIIDEKIKEIKNYFKNKIDIENDLKIYDINDEIDSSQLYNFLNTPSFFSIKKILIIKNCEKISKDLVKIISDFLNKNLNPNQDVCIFFTSTDFRKVNFLKEIVSKFGELISIQKPDTENLKKYVIEKAELDGIKINQDALELFIGNINEDINILENEYEKLYLNVCFEKNKIITKEIVKNLVSKNISFTIFNFVDYIGGKNFKNAAQFLSEMAEDENIIGNIIWQLFLMFKCLLFLKAGLDGKEEAKNYLARNIKTNPNFLNKIINKYLIFSKNYSTEEIIEIISILNDFDIRKRKIKENNLNLLFSLLAKIQFM